MSVVLSTFPSDVMSAKGVYMDGYVDSISS